MIIDCGCGSRERPGWKERTAGLHLSRLGRESVDTRTSTLAGYGPQCPQIHRHVALFEMKILNLLHFLRFYYTAKIRIQIIDQGRKDKTFSKSHKI